MDPPDLLSVELSTSRPTQHLGRMKREPPPRPPQPAIFTHSKWGCSGCLGPRPLSPLSPLLEGTEPRRLAVWKGKRVCAVSLLLLLTQPGMPSFLSSPSKPGLTLLCCAWASLTGEVMSGMWWQLSGALSSEESCCWPVSAVIVC
ncbi:tyrosine kinase, non-receptor, 2, isoform CRA_d, partial [Rattus norvegicus]